MSAGPTNPRPSPISPEFLARFRAAAGDLAQLRFDRFVDLALYDAQVGYYRRPVQRVGYAPGTDFFTATTSGPLFGELIVAACRSLLSGRDLAQFQFVEIGAEPGGGVLDGVVHPFASVKTLRLGLPLTLSGRSIVFSNELFDAQPFRRFVRQQGQWLETGVALRDGNLEEVVLDGKPELPVALPDVAAEGYRLDLPLAAMELAATIAAQPWDGLFVAFDYGKTWRELSEETPGGTARGYFKHRQSNDLLAQPGEQDLTCHVCWDWIAEKLQAAGFAGPALEFQESFFMHHAQETIASVLAAEATRLSQRKLALMQLLHPSHLGQKFQVLHAVREAR